MSIVIRSNCGYKAAFMNMLAFTELQQWVAQQVGVEVGSYVHYAESFHVYGSYFDEFKGFLDTVKNRPVEDRVWNTDFAIPFFLDGCDEILKETDLPEDKRLLVIKRKEYLQNKLSDIS